MKFIKLEDVYGRDIRINIGRIIALEASNGPNGAPGHTRVHIGAGKEEFFAVIESPATILHRIKAAR